MAAKKRFKLRIPPSLIADSQSHVSRTSSNGTPLDHSTALDTAWHGMVARIGSGQIVCCGCVGGHKGAQRGRRRHSIDSEPGINGKEVKSLSSSGALGNRDLGRKLKQEERIGGQ